MFDCSHANYAGCKDDTTAIGSYETGKSPYGIYDLAGNVQEWVADWYSETYYQNSSSSNPQGPALEQYHVMRGGAWDDVGLSLRTSDRFWGNPPNSAFDSYGFRCAFTP